MNSLYLSEYANNLERVLSSAKAYFYHTPALERMISYNKFFIDLENDHNKLLSPIITSQKLVPQIFEELAINLDNVPTYIECLWAAEMYLRIQGYTQLSFEAIFLYLPISKMYELFPIYHEMDFSRMLNVFDEIRNNTSTFEILVKRSGFTLKDISRKIDIPYSTLLKIKKRRRDIKKVNSETVIKLSKILLARVETITEIAC